MSLRGEIIEILTLDKVKINLELMNCTFMTDLIFNNLKKNETDIGL